MPSRNKYIFLLFFLLSISQKTFAQFKGGDANGGDSKSLTQTLCPSPENTNIYFGGDANGAGLVSLFQSICLPPINLNIYFGGDANGFSSQKITQGACLSSENLNFFLGGSSGAFNQSFIQTSCPFPENTNIHYGGNANGASSQYITNCPVAVPVNIFNGGNTDGYAKLVLSQSSCSASENTNVFLGGDAEGYAFGSLSQSVCIQPEALNIFFGGNADGYEQKLLSQLICPPAENVTISIGGSADGQAVGYLSQTVCPSYENTNIFFGGSADGYSSQSLTQSICAFPENNLIFLGGNSDGHAIGSLIQLVCPAPENYDIFLGGNGDGDAFGYLSQTVCPAPENTNIFLGGDADGFSLKSFTQQVCPSSENINVFLGGNADGYAIKNLTQLVCSTPENLNIFSGGNGGIFKAKLTQTLCPFPENVNIYYGGNANGSSSQYISNCPFADPVNIYNGGNANGASVQVLTQSICPSPVNLNIYFGGNANGAGNQRAIQSICSTPENLNIYLGGNANGASNKKVIRSICPLPENLNIYLGGNANGAANQSATQSICPLPENLNIYLGGNANGSSSQSIKPSICPAPQNLNIFFGGIADGYAHRMLIQPYYWTGAVDHNWHNPLNWSSEVVPDISSIAIIPNVVNFPIISLAIAESRSLVIQNGAKLQITNKNFTSEFSVVNDGTIIITGNPIITIGGDLNCENGLITTDNAKFVFNATTGIQSVNFNSADVYEVEIATAPVASCQLASALTIRQNINISAGNFNASSFGIVLNGNWNNTGNFMPGTGTVTFNGISQTISNALGEHFYRLTTQNNTQLILNNKIQVSSNLTMTSGTILTGANILTLGSGVGSPGSLNYVSGRIIGKFEKWITTSGSYFFPIGNSINNLAVSLEINSGITSGSVLIYFVSSNPGNGGLPISESGITVQNQYSEGYWNVTANNGFAVTDYNITLAANGFSTYYFNFYTRVIKRTNSGGWLFDGTHANASPPACYRNNLTGGISSLGTQFAIGAMACSGGTISDNYSIIFNGDVPPFVSVDQAKGGADTFSYSWLYTTNSLAIPGDSNWTSIPLSDTNAYDYGTLSTTTRFVREATSVGCDAPAYSNVLIITVNDAPVTGPMYHIPNSF